MFGSTEIFAFGDDGNARRYGETGQEMLGKTRIWEVLEERYLPLYRPSFVPDHIEASQLEDYMGFKPKRIHASHTDRDKALNEIFDLIYSGKLTRNERVVLMSTFDNVVVEKSFLPRVIEALRTFTDKHNENLLAQADLLKKALNDPEIWGIAWNQSSMHSDRWDSYVPYQKGEHPDWNEADANEQGVVHFREPYNMNRDNVHWDMVTALADLPVTDNEVKYRVEYAIFPLRAIYYGYITLPKEMDMKQVELEIHKEFQKQGFRIRKVEELKLEEVAK